MLDFEEIKKQYSESMQKFDRGLLREYIQYEILGIIYSHPFSKKLIFLGGTCLRIVYGLKRFSEDLDFDNFDLSIKEFETLCDYIKKELEKLGFIVQIKIVAKKAFRCYVRFPKILYEKGLSPLQDEKILIQLDTFDQNVNYSPEIFILDKFDLFDQIQAAPKDVILSQKLWTITQRKRFKGRDFYDAMFLLQNTKPYKKFLYEKFKSKDIQEIKKIILDKISDINWDIIVKDVAPFLFDSTEAAKIKFFKKFFKQVKI